MVAGIRSARVPLRVPLVAPGAGIAGGTVRNRGQSGCRSTSFLSMIRRAAPLTFLVALLALPVTAAAQDTPAPTISKPTLSASGTISTKVTLPDGGLYAQQFFSGRVLLCRVAQAYKSAGTHRVACRIRIAALRKLRLSGRVRFKIEEKVPDKGSEQLETIRVVIAGFAVQAFGNLILSNSNQPLRAEMNSTVKYPSP